MIATFVTPLKNLLGAGDEQVGFRLTMMIFALAMGVFFIPPDQYRTMLVVTCMGNFVIGPTLAIV